MKLRCWSAITVAIVALASEQPAAGQASMQTLLTNGPTANRLNIVFLSEGYTTDDLAHYPSDAMKMLHAILTNSPLSEYSNCFNAFAISIPSNESGSDHYTPTTSLVDTYFNSSYGSPGGGELTGSSRLIARGVAASTRCSPNSCPSTTSWRWS